MAESHLADRAGSSSSTAQQRHQDVDALLDACYDALDQEVFFSKGGFVIPPAERQEIDATGGSASYGEILGVQQLLWCLGPMDSGSSVFVDLGSGRGRCVLQVAAHSDAAACIGLELSDSRLEQAELALQQLQQQAAGGLRLRPVQFRRADLGTCSLEEGTHFYMCSTAFGSAICRSIAQRLSQSANFQVLVTSRQLPSQPFLMLAGEVPCGFTYSANGRAYVYVKSLAAAPPGVLARLWCRDGVCWLPGMRDAQMAIAEPEPLDSGDAAARYVQLSSELLHGTD